MKKINLYCWEELKEWAEQYQHQGCVFRGQGDSTWTLTTSLARHFLAHDVISNEWRKRELKMYHIFRERLINICPGMYEQWEPIDILSLMQHHGTPTRLLDFSYSPWVASYFALIEARGNSAVWVIDTQHLVEMQKIQGFPTYSGPSHIEDYKMAEKHSGAAILHPSYPHQRLAAQRGCFLVPGQISKKISTDLINSCVILSEDLVLDSITKLRGLGIDDEFLFPNLDKIAQDTNRFSVTGSANFPSNHTKTGEL